MLPPAHTLALHHAPPRLALQGEQLAIIDVPTATPTWSHPAPEGAHQVVWRTSGDAIAVATRRGEVLTFDAATGELQDRAAYDDGPVWIDGDDVLCASGRVVPRAGRSGAAWTTPRRIARPLGDRVHLEAPEAPGGPWWVVQRTPDRDVAAGRAPDRRAILVPADGWLWATDRGKLVTCTPAGDRTTLAVLPFPDEPRPLAAIRPDHQLALDLAARGAVRAYASHAWLVWTADRLVHVLAKPGQPPTVTATLSLPDVHAVARSVDGRWIAVATPTETRLVAMAAFLTPPGGPPDLHRLDGLPAVLDAIRAWPYRDADVDEALAAAVAPNPIEALPAALRPWALAREADDVFGWEGFRTALRNDDARCRLYPDALDTLGHPAAAALWREALALHDAAAPTAAFDALDRRGGREARFARAARMTWLRAHVHALAADLATP